MIPGEIKTYNGNIIINKNRKKIRLIVQNYGDRAIQVGSHYHFYEVNNALFFNRSKTKGFRLNIISGTAVRFEPGQKRKVILVMFASIKKILGFNKKIMGYLK